MRGLFVHIGLHKTGSSTIQGFLRDNERALVERGYEFSSVGRGHGLGNIDIANSVSERRNALGDRRGSAETLAAEVRARPERTHVISAEAFETLNDEDVARLAAALAGIPVTVVCYIRNTPAHVQSRYAQLAKAASLDTDFDAFFERLRDSLSVLPKLERWGAAFGWENLVVASVDGFSPATPDLVHHFLGALGIADTAGLRFARGSRNVSPGWKTLEAARAVFSGTPLLLRARGVTEDRTDAAMQKLRRLTLEAIEAAAAGAGPGLPPRHRQRQLPAPGSAADRAAGTSAAGAPPLPPRLRRDPGDGTDDLPRRLRRRAPRRQDHPAAPRPRRRPGHLHGRPRRVARASPSGSTPRHASGHAGDGAGCGATGRRCIHGSIQGDQASPGRRTEAATREAQSPGGTGRQGWRASDRGARRRAVGTPGRAGKSSGRRKRHIPFDTTLV